MIKHVVMFRFKPLSDGKTEVENAQYIKKQYEDLKELIPQINSVEMGLNDIEGDNNYHAVLVMTFKSLSEMAIYKVNKHHLAIKNHLNKIVKDRIVVDYIIE